MNDLPLCVECAHMRPALSMAGYGPYAFARCELATKVNPVTGEATHYHCSTERTSGTCGPHGTRFTAKVEAA
jgi:hypothetical protein